MLFIIFSSGKEGFETTGNSFSYTAVIVEPREHKALPIVVQNALDSLSDEWEILVMHGNRNEDFVKKELKQKDKRRIRLHNLNVDNLTIPEYNRLLVSAEFYSPIHTEIFLIFQTDSGFCGPADFSAFMQYDYVGAPWLYDIIHNPYYPKEHWVGNGGFSLRRKSKMMEIIEKCPYNNQSEDVYFAVPCSKVSINKPTIEPAKEFAVETMYSDKSIGFHKPWLYLNKEDIEKLEKRCPTLNQITTLQ